MIHVFDGFDWDDANATKIYTKHGIPWLEAEEIFFNNPLVFFDAKHSKEEQRWIAFGKANSGRLLTAAFTFRNKKHQVLIRPISVRLMNKKEKLLYEETIAKIQK